MTIEQQQEAIIAEFAPLTDWLDRYDYLISLGRRYSGMDDSLKIPSHAVPGCQSKVWIRAQNRGGRLRLSADSDSLIVRGILSLIVRVCDDQPSADIQQEKMFFLERTGLAAHLSPARRDGLSAVIHYIRDSCSDIAEVNTDHRS
ncbi:MAG: SufE family protein [Candidatus Omnitrophota bacterium]